MLRYILFHHQTTTQGGFSVHRHRCVISSFITKPQRDRTLIIARLSCVISSFITKPQPGVNPALADGCCVISSFITKPQLMTEGLQQTDGCVISSFITKPQLILCNLFSRTVALYPLSSPNHNYTFFLLIGETLRYILFHHQTTTVTFRLSTHTCCVISSFITKPQRWRQSCAC